MTEIKNNKNYLVGCFILFSGGAIFGLHRFYYKGSKSGIRYLIFLCISIFVPLGLFSISYYLNISLRENLFLEYTILGGFILSACIVTFAKLECLYFIIKYFNEEYWQRTKNPHLGNNKY